MQLQGRELGMMTTGDDVKLLQRELRQLGYSIPDTEAQQGFFGQNTQAAVLDFQRKHSLQPTGRVDQSTATMINRDVDALGSSFIVHGLVRHPDGKPVTDVVVAAFDRDLRSEERLGDIATTDAEGRYEIKYAAGQFSRAEKKTADLVVRVYKDKEMSPPALAESPIIFNAQPVETVDLVFGNQPFRGPAEFDELLADIAPLLAANKLQPAQLNDADIEFLSGETGQPAGRLNSLVTAHKLSDVSKNAALSPDVFYGLFRQNLPTDLDALLAQSVEVLRNALAAAGRDNVIRERTKDEINQILELLKQLRVQRTLNAPPNQSKAILKDLLNLSSLKDVSLQTTLLTDYFSHQGSIEDFWKSLRAKPEFTDHIDDLQFTLQLAALTQAHLPLAIELKTQQQRGVINHLRDLAKLDVEDWKGMVTKPPTSTGDPLHPSATPIGFPPDTPGETDAEKTDNYAKSLTRSLEDAFPTVAIAGRIEKSSLPNKADFQTFFRANQAFDFGTTYIDSYLTDNPTALDQIKDKTGFTGHLKAMQRVYKLTPRYGEMRTLMGDGLTSAGQVAGMGKSAFTAKYKSTLGSESSTIIYQNAEQVAAMALNVVANYAPYFNDISLRVLPAGLQRATTTHSPTRRAINLDAAAALAASTANLETLFGSFNLCACQECNSVHGPTAYLVDILHFLDERRAARDFRSEGGRIIVIERSAKDILFARRPDIGQIELTCENTNTPVPYVDLVNEILEDAVSPATATEARAHQTTLTPLELAAAPQYLNAGAYIRLSRQVYPFSPFNLDLEEARIYLNHLGVPRHELMRAFLNSADAHDSADPAVIAIAVEHLGLSEFERQIVTGQPLPTPHHDWDFWGLAAATAGSSWHTPLGQVSFFLARSGLSYQELTELISLNFITVDNADPITITAVAEGDPLTCDTTKLSLNFGTSDAPLSRIHRFLRLWRKLGWPMRELDQAISVLRGAVAVAERLDNTLLVGLSQIQMLRAELNLTVAETLALWQFTDPAGAEQPPLRVKLLAKGLGLSTSDTLAYVDLIQIDPFSAPAPENTLRFVAAVRKSRATGFSIVQLNYLLRHQFTAASGVAPTEAHIAQTLDDLRTGLRKIRDDPTVLPEPEGDLTAKELALVKQKLGVVLQWDAATTDALLEHWVKSSAEPAQAAITDFLDPTFVTSPPGSHVTPADFPPQFATLIRLHKIATVISRFGITTSQLIWVFDYAAAGGWLNLASLPDAAGAPRATFGSWERLTDLFRLRDSLPQGATALTDVLNRAHQPVAETEAMLSLNELWRQLSEHTQWPLESVTALGALLTSATRDYQALSALARMLRCMTLMVRLCVSVDRCLAWAQPELTSAAAGDLKQIVKSKYDPEQWLAVAKPLRKVLRELQRAALVAYLLANNTDPHRADTAGWEDVNDLYAYFLIDVEMSPCQLTSRIVQAAASVQLFVQRCLMNLEPEVQAADSDWLQWKWMRKFRVWEANRKIFLYPENWIEPELRDDKSPFFKELEKELLQNDVTIETAEEAFLKYLEKLDEVSRLEIVGLYHQESLDADDEEILHVFGRTHNSPHRYYYRRWINQSYWTAWEKVDLDIEGDHLIPVVWNRRLYLFWPLFTEASLDEALPNAGEQGKKPTKFWEIKLAWSTYRNKKWSAKKVSASAMTTDKSHDPLPVPPEKKYFFFKTRVVDRLHIACFLAEFSWFREIPGGLAGPIRLPLVFPDFLGYKSVGAFDIDEDLAGIDIHYPDNLAYWREFLHSNPEDPLFFPIPEGTMEESMTVKEVFRGAPLVLRSAQLNEQGDLIRDTLLRRPTLANTTGIFKLIFPPQFLQFVSQAPFFLQDSARTFLVANEMVTSPRNPEERDLFAAAAIATLFGADGVLPQFYRFRTFYHPYLRLFGRQLNRQGLDGLLQRNIQVNPDTQPNQPPAFDFSTYGPSLGVARPYPIEDVDFSQTGAYAQYNWELFFHIPLLIADRLSKNQRFEEAQKWFHYIFDPTDTSAEDVPQKYWLTEPFFKTRDGYQVEQIQRLLESLASGHPDPELTEQVKQWRAHPFNPHVIARLRTTAYQKTVVMKYLDNLIAWGDQLFRGESLESINEAAQLYILAADILGRRPEVISSRATTAAKTYNSLEGALHAGDFSDPLVEVENLIPSPGSSFVASMLLPPSVRIAIEAEFSELMRPSMLRFCVPKNSKLLDYWNIVADRLFKIRHCMNIEGVVRQLPLFEPPIDPALLVRAAAAGVDINSALSDINAPLPHYRFNVMSQKASELVSEVKALGAALLSALEKKDAEDLALLRSGHELNLLRQVREVKSQQVEEAQRTLEGLTRAKEVAEIRHNFYASIKFMNANEKTHLDLMTVASFLQTLAQMMEEAAAPALASPTFIVGAAGWAASPLTVVQQGGSNVGSSLQAFGRAMNMYASVLNLGANQSSILGGYQRRWDDWKLQEKLAEKEVDQITKQIVAAEIRVAIANQELVNHDLQTKNAQEVDEFMRAKYTNVELYTWMVGQISSVYFQSYQLAYDVAKRAERAYRFELGLQDSNFIQFGYWDSLKKGLLAGERLYHDIKRLEVAYLDQNKREYEITRHFSLAMIDPLALVKLRENGECFVDLPEALFDMDYPGHYLRRIKSAGLTIPCVVGPYTSINCTLTLLGNSVRRTTNTSGGYARHLEGDDRFADNLGAIQSIATSSAQNDSGMFELNFRDERYLPFEGAGAISSWRVEMPRNCNQFDFNTISDVVLHLKYTARDGGEALKNEALTAVVNATPRAGIRLFSARHEFASEWYRFMNPPFTALEQRLGLPLTRDHFPFTAEVSTPQISRIELFLLIKDRDVYNPDASVAPYEGHELRLSVTPIPDESRPATLARDPGFGNVPHKTLQFVSPQTVPMTLSLEALEADIRLIAEEIKQTVSVGDTSHTRLRADAIEDMVLVCHYHYSID